MQKTRQSGLELLAPAGDKKSLLAALDHGADAVYFGARSFSARSQAENFAGAGLAEAIELAHLHGVYAYLALNTLIKDDELAAALQLADQAYAFGIDALIVQDPGLARLLKQRLPDLPLHASTQLTITDEAGLKLAQRLGMTRVILARELTLPEIADLTGRAGQLGLETEVFIHGAVCLGLSGQCLLSSFFGGRSGNRGDCAQPCRLPYTIPAHGPDPANWLSPCDQALPQALADLHAAGVSCLKIEGRQKNAAYVAQVTAVYRQLLDKPGGALPAKEEAELNLRLALAFNRGGRFSQRVASGRMGEEFLSGPYSGSHGIYLGRLEKLAAPAGRLWLKSSRQDDFLPQRADILSVREQDKEIASAPVGVIRKEKDLLMVQGFHPAVLARMRPGLPVYQMSSARAIQLAGQARPARSRLGLAVELDQAEIRLRARIQNGPLAGLEHSCSTPAMSVPALASQRAKEQLAKTGGTSFLLASCPGLPDLPLTISALNQLRRELLEQLATRIRQEGQRQLPAWPEQESTIRSARQVKAALPTKIVAFFYRLPERAEDLACQADSYVLPLFTKTVLELKKYLNAVRAKEPAARLYAWIPPARYGRLARLLAASLGRLSAWGFDGLVANLTAADLLPTNQASSLSWALDSSANVFNRSALAFWQEQGADFIVPSLELSDSELAGLALEQEDSLGLTIAVYGRARLLSSAFCALGFNEPGCRKCRQGDFDQQYALFGRQGREQTILTYPQYCQMEIIHQENKKDFSRIRRLDQQAARSWQAGFYFLNESQARRRDLIREFHEVDSYARGEN